jgi:hypothetical protein
MSTAQENVQAFQTWHSSRTYNPGHPQIDPWMRDVLLSLQNTLRLMAEQIDRDSDRIRQLEAQVSQLQRTR